MMMILGQDNSEELPPGMRTVEFPTEPTPGTVFRMPEQGAPVLLTQPEGPYAEYTFNDETYYMELVPEQVPVEPAPTPEPRPDWYYTPPISYPEKERYRATPEGEPVYRIPELQPMPTPEKQRITTPEKERDPEWRTFVIEEGVTYEPVEYDLPVEPVVTFPAREEPVFRQVHMVVDAPQPEPEPAIVPEDGRIAFDTTTLLWLGGGAALLLALVALGRLRRGVS